MNPLQLMLDELKRREIHMAGRAMGIITLEDAADLLQILEIKMLNENGPVFRHRKRIPRQLPENQKATIRVAEETFEDVPKDRAVGGGLERPRRGNS